MSAIQGAPEYDDDVKEALLWDRVGKQKPAEPASPLTIVLLITANSLVMFAYAGLLAMLAIFVNDELKYTEDEASYITNCFVATTLFCSIIGGLVSDASWGKVKTLTLAYTLLSAGYATMMMAHLFGHDLHSKRAISFSGLGVICLAMGIGQPCMTSLIGDQRASDEEEEERAGMFRAYYFSLNIGVLIGAIFMPGLSQLAGGYKLAFFLMLGVAILCILLLLLSNPTRLGGHGVAGAVCCCSCDRDSKHDLWRIVKFFLPLPIFWLLFYNMLSLWTFEAKHMDRRLFGHEIAAGTMSALNSLFDVLLIPLFQFAIYPALRKKGYTLKPHHRIAWGMIFAVLAMVAAGVLQLYVDQDPTMPQPITQDSAQALRLMELMARASPGVHVLYQVPQYFFISVAEILISITALEYAYQMAPANFKGFVMALFCLAQGFGNVLLAVVTIVNFASKPVQFFAMGGLMLVTFIVFLLATLNYDYNRQSTKQRDIERDE